jgi:hypothetical protein
LYWKIGRFNGSFARRQVAMYPHDAKDTFHTPLSAGLRLVGQLAAISMPVLLALAAGGMGSGVFAVAGGAWVAATSLLLSSALRNINRWKKQAAAGFEPQSVGIVALAIGQALLQEESTVSAYEFWHDAENCRLIRRRRTAKRNNAAGESRQVRVPSVTQAVYAEPFDCGLPPGARTH